MKLYDCFMFYDEKLLLEIRFNILNKFVDKFIITEANYLHNGDSKKLNFNINDFNEFKNKIEYIVVDNQPEDIQLIGKEDNELAIDEKKISNSLKRENFQREMISKGLTGLNKEDIILIAGKGHEDYQIFNDNVIDFDDRKIANKILKEKSLTN